MVCKFGGNMPRGGKNRSIPDGLIKNFSTIVNIGSGICILVSIICLISIASLRKEVDTYHQEIGNQLISMQEKERQLEERLNAAGNRTGLYGANVPANGNAGGRINITKQPTDSSTYLGRGGMNDNKQDVPIFTVSATGSNLKFIWQRYEDGSREWVDIVLDENGCNEEMGLRVIGDLENTYSELDAHDVKAIAYGTYRCQISDTDGVQYTDAVVLSERDNK